MRYYSALTELAGPCCIECKQFFIKITDKKYTFLENGHSVDSVSEIINWLYRMSKKYINKREKGPKIALHLYGGGDLYSEVDIMLEYGPWKKKQNRP